MTVAISERAVDFFLVGGGCKKTEANKKLA